MIKLTKGGIIPKGFVGVVGPISRVIGHEERNSYGDGGYPDFRKYIIYQFDVEVIYDNRPNITLSFNCSEHAQKAIDEIYSKINKS